jgi:uncharacterized protein DUF4190
MSTPDPQQPADLPPDGPRAGGADATEPAPGVSFDKPTEQVPAPQAGPSYEQPTAPTYGPHTGQPYDPLPGQAYDPQTGLPLGPPPGPPPAPQGTAGYDAPYGPPPGYGPQHYSPQHQGPQYQGPQYQGPQYYGGYAPPGYPVYLPRPTNGMAIASLVLGILWLYWVGSIMALVFGYVAQQQIRQRGESGGGIAIAGIVLGWIGVATLAFLLLFLSIAAGAPGPY